MDRRPPSQIALWVLITVASQPVHAYAVSEMIMSSSQMTVRPSRGMVKFAITSLLSKGLLKVMYRETGEGSDHERVVYAITEMGLKVMNYERYRTAQMMRTMDSALAQS